MAVPHVKWPHVEWRVLGICGQGWWDKSGHGAFCPVTHLRAKHLLSASAQVQVNGYPLSCGMTRGFPTQSICMPWRCEDLVYLVGHGMFGCELKSGGRSGQGI